MHILVLSPHRGDAAFSLTHALGRWMAARNKVTILTVFTRSLSAPFSDADTVHPNDRLAYVSALRRREDEQFLKLIPGATMLDLNLKDAPIRLHTDPELAAGLDPDPADTAIPKIQKAIAKLNPAAIVLPLGLTGHVDHLVVRAAAQLPSPDLPCAFYEDLGEDSASTGTTTPPDFHPIAMSSPHPDPVALKRRTAMLYASQIDAALADTIAHRPERLWVNDAWTRHQTLSS